MSTEFALFGGQGLGECLDLAVSFICIAAMAKRICRTSLCSTDVWECNFKRCGDLLLYRSKLFCSDQVVVLLYVRLHQVI